MSSETGWNLHHQIHWLPHFFPALSVLPDAKHSRAWEPHIMEAIPVILLADMGQSQKLDSNHPKQ